MIHFHMIIIGENYKRIDDELHYLNIDRNHKSIIKLVNEQDSEKLMGVELDENIPVAIIGYNKYTSMFIDFIKTRMRIKL